MQWDNSILDAPTLSSSIHGVALSWEMAVVEATRARGIGMAVMDVLFTEVIQRYLTHHTLLNSSCSSKMPSLSTSEVKVPNLSWIKLPSFGNQ